MPKGQKECPKCQKAAAPRTQTCECGHVFKKELAPVSAGVVPMGQSVVDEDDPLNIKGSISNVKKILMKAGSVRPTIQTVNPSRNNDTSSHMQEAIGAETLRIKTSAQLTYVPSGEPPFKPEGFKTKAWTLGDGGYNDEIIKNWAIKVYNSGTERCQYHPHAITYWARYFWNDCSPLLDTKAEWDRIKNLILDTLTPAGQRNIEDDQLFA